MKKILFASVLTFLSVSMYGQDTIVMRDGEKIPAKIIELAKKEVVYKKAKNPTGPNYRMDVYDVGRIKYESGAVDELNPLDNEVKEQSVTTLAPSMLGNNIISMGVVELLLENITLSYERIVGKDRRLGLRVPLSMSLSAPGTLPPNRTLMYTGLDLNFYPMGQGQFRFVIGPAIRIGRARFQDQLNIEPGNYQTVNMNANFFNFLVQGGFSWNPVKELSMLMTFGFGTRRYFIPSELVNDPTVSGALFNFGVGYRF